MHPYLLNCHIGRLALVMLLITRKVAAFPVASRAAYRYEEPTS